jgi:hypothetical protein
MSQKTAPPDAPKVLRPHRRTKDAFRRIALEVSGSALYTLVGAFLGMQIPGDLGPGHAILVCLFAFLGWLLWVRRRRRLLVTLAIWAILILAWWPLAFALRALLRA